MFKKIAVVALITASLALAGCSASKRAQLSSDLDNAGNQLSQDTSNLGKSIKKGAHNVVDGTVDAAKAVGREMGEMADEVKDDFY